MARDGAVVFEVGTDAEQSKILAICFVLVRLFNKDVLRYRFDVSRDECVEVSRIQAVFLSVRLESEGDDG